VFQFVEALAKCVEMEGSKETWILHPGTVMSEVTEDAVIGRGEDFGDLL
jgi:hypothetical protein